MGVLLGDIICASKEGATGAELDRSGQQIKARG